MKTITILLSGLTSIMSILKTVETNNNPDSIGDNGRSYGILQIQRSVLSDVNRIYGTDYRHKDMFYEEASKRYLCYIFVMVKKYSLRNIVDSLQKRRWLECGMAEYTRDINIIKLKFTIKSI